MPAASINHTVGIPFIEINSVDSSNNYAVQQLRSGLPMHGTAYFAHEQTAGKGQRGKQWHTLPGQNIALSVVLNATALQVSQQFTLSMAISLATYDLILKYTEDYTFIKWPNDLYWRDRKTAGILIENIIRGKEWQWAVVGIGINVNQTVFDASIKNPVSLKQITGRHLDPVTLSKDLCKNIEIRFNQINNKETDRIFVDFNKRLYKKEELVKLKKSNSVFDCVIKHVNPSGQLVVLRQGFEQLLNVGDVEWLI